MFFEFITNLFFPRMCLACRDPIGTGVVCGACFEAISLRNAPPIRSADTPYALGAAGNYSDEILQALIHALKFRSIKDAAIPLGKLLVAYAKNIHGDLSGHTVVPIPLSRRRLRARGWNQSELIAEYFATALELPLELRALARAKHAKPQSETKNVEERAKNILGAFGVPHPELVFGKNIILIDDVSTSGATFLEASRALKQAGAKDILALAVAKT